jgi:hypothetical protein
VIFGLQLTLDLGVVKYDLSCGTVSWLRVPAHNGNDFAYRSLYPNHRLSEHSNAQEMHLLVWHPQQCVNLKQ